MPVSSQAKPAVELFDDQFASFEVVVDDRGDLEFASRRRLDGLGGLDHSRVEVVQPGDRPVARRIGGLLLDLGGAPVGVEVDDAVPLRVLDVVAEHGGAGRPGGGAGDELREAGAVEQVVAEHERRALPVEEVGADQERLRQPVGRVLRGVGELDAPLRTVAEQPLEARPVLWAW